MPRNTLAVPRDARCTNDALPGSKCTLSCAEGFEPVSTATCLGDSDDAVPAACDGADDGTGTPCDGTDFDLELAMRRPSAATMHRV